LHFHSSGSFCSFLMESKRIAIIGAGLVGLYVGGHLAHHGHSVLFIGRERYGKQIQQHGLTVSNLSNDVLKPANFEYSTDTGRLAQVNAFDYIIITLKAVNTSDAIEMLKDVDTSIPILSLQNGVHNAQDLRQSLVGRTVITGMFPFNVVELDNCHLHQASAGKLMVDENPVGRELSELLTKAGILTVVHPNMIGVLYGKLLINLNNAVNALAGINTRSMISDHSYRYISALLIEEALVTYQAAKIIPETVTGTPIWTIPYALKSPSWLFKRIAAATVSVDKNAFSSMYDDLKNGRTTEVDMLNGEILSLGRKYHVATPYNQLLIELIKKAETEKKGSPKLSAQVILEKMRAKPHTSYALLTAVLFVISIPVSVLAFVVSKLWA